MTGRAITDWRRLSAPEKREGYYRIEPQSRSPAMDAVRREALAALGVIAGLLGSSVVLSFVNLTAGILAAAPLLYLGMIVPLNLAGDYYVGKTAAFESFERGGSVAEARSEAIKAVRTNKWTWGSL